MSDFECVDGKWKQSMEVMDKNGDEKIEWVSVYITGVPTGFLLREWEDLVHELSEKEVELLKLKEYIAVKSFEIEQETDFKTLYGKNNADVRKHHIKQELGDVFDEVQALELSISWIKGYVPLLRECIRIKRD